MTDITVAQADREAAARWFVYPSYAEIILQSSRDRVDELAVAFAAHRIAAIEECARIAESDDLILSDSRGPGSFGGTRKDHGQLIARMLRALTNQPHNQEG